MTETGQVFDIQRCSLHDGPGIRTTVFLKGCQLHCEWCHNPESIAFQAQVSYLAEHCVHCLVCVDVCQHGAQQVDAEGHHVRNHALCIACGECIDTCQGDALKLIGKEMDAEEVLVEVERDRAFYQRSGGGMTISGGEPMMQFQFTRALLAAARNAGIHTALETNLAVRWDKYAELLPLVDLFLCDYKATVSETHHALTGMGNELILANLDRLIQAGKAVVLRCPLVPGVNDDRSHLQGIADLSLRYPQLSGVEIMAYHNLGVAKSSHIGDTALLADIPSASPETQTWWIEILHGLGCKKAKLS